MQHQPFSDYWPSNGDGAYQEQNWAERDIIISMLTDTPQSSTPYYPTYAKSNTPDYSSFLPSSLGEFIAPLSAATLNGKTFEEVCAPQTYTSKYSAIDEGYGFAIPRHAYTSGSPTNQYATRPTYPQQPASLRNPYAHEQQFLPANYAGMDSIESNKRKRAQLPVDVSQTVPNGHTLPSNGWSAEREGPTKVQRNGEISNVKTEREIAVDEDEEEVEEVDEKKEKDKAVRSRESSRRYRQRKRECFEKMKKELDVFENEKKKWLEERDASRKLIEKLKSENEVLKNRTNIDAIKFKDERLALLADLDKKVKRGASDEELIPTLTQIKERCGCIKQVSQNLLCQYVSPDAATYLAGIGFFKDIDAIEVDRPSKEQSIYSFATKLESEIPDLTMEQKEKIRMHVGKFYHDILKIVDERKALASELQSLYNAQPILPEAAPGGGAQQPDTQMILERVSSLQGLRENLMAESDLSLTTIAAMLDELKPMQAAKFLVKAHFVHNAVMQLQMIWDALKASRAEND